jgi:hypothetical protein
LNFDGSKRFLCARRWPRSNGRSPIENHHSPFINRSSSIQSSLKRVLRRNPLLSAVVNVLGLLSSRALSVPAVNEWRNIRCEDARVFGSPVKESTFAQSSFVHFCPARYSENPSWKRNPLQVYLAISKNLPFVGAVHHGGWEFRSSFTERSAMTANIAVKPTERSGRRRRMSKLPLRGRPKAVAADSVRLF